MNTLTLNPLARNVSFDDDAMWIEFTDGRKLGVPLVYFPSLMNATFQQRKKFEISGGGTGIHWDELNEDISVKHLLMGYGDHNRAPYSGPSQHSAA